MGTYDQINKIKDKYNSIIIEKDKEIDLLSKKVDELKAKNDEYRHILHDLGEGKSENARLKNIINDKERERKTLENKLKDIDGSKLISSFIPERQELIRNIQKLEFNNSIYNSLARKFKDGLDNVIEVAYRIKKNYVKDMDYYTFVFRDNIVGLLEKMLGALIKEKEPSASKYLLKLRDGVYKLPNDYYQRMPNLKNVDILDAILALINLQSNSYHGTKIKQSHLMKDKESSELISPIKFLNLSNDMQLNAIFTLLEFIYDFFTNKDYETNLIVVSSNWFITM